MRRIFLLVAIYTWFVQPLAAQALSEVEYQLLEAKQLFHSSRQHEAFDIWLPLAQQGNATAQNAVGWMFQTGLGAPKIDILAAAKWTRLAARQGVVGAQYRMGNMYRFGDGVILNEQEAAKWFRLGAEQGHPYSQYALGSMYKTGEGVQKNLIDALKWVLLANLNRDLTFGPEPNFEVDFDSRASWDIPAIEAGMSSDQITTARHRADACLASDYQDCD